MDEEARFARAPTHCKNVNNNGELTIGYERFGARGGKIILVLILL